jgi:hypothetical protein
LQRRINPEDGFEEGRFTRAIRAQETGEASLAKSQVNIGENDAAAVANCQLIKG